MYNNNRMHAGCFAVLGRTDCMSDGISAPCLISSGKLDCLLFIHKIWNFNAGIIIILYNVQTSITSIMYMISQQTKH